MLENAVVLVNSTAQEQTSWGRGRGDSQGCNSQVGFAVVSKERRGMSFSRGVEMWNGRRIQLDRKEELLGSLLLG